MKLAVVSCSSYNYCIYTVIVSGSSSAINVPVMFWRMVINRIHKMILTKLTVSGTCCEGIMFGEFVGLEKKVVGDIITRIQFQWYMYQISIIQYSNDVIYSSNPKWANLLLVNCIDQRENTGLNLINSMINLLDGWELYLILPDDW
jgi:hypothetical protein